MVIYENTKKGFIHDVETERISDKLKYLFRSNSIGSGEREYESWKNSSVYTKNVLSNSCFDDDIRVYLEYQVFLTGKRVDLLIAGTDDSGNNKLLLLS